MTSSTQSAVEQPFVGQALAASLTVRDIHASMAWYRDVVGFKVVQEVERDGALQSVAISAGAVRLRLNQDDGAKGRDRLKGAGMSFMITTEQEIDAVAARIKAHGATLLLEPTDVPWGARVCRVADPDGFTFLISTPM